MANGESAIVPKVWSCRLGGAGRAPDLSMGVPQYATTRRFPTTVGALSAIYAL